MADFNAAIEIILRREGGARVTDHPQDKGGLTKFGISQRAHPHLDIIKLTKDDAKALYKQGCWDKIQGDFITDQAMAEEIFDSAVNMGVHQASCLAQLAANTVCLLQVTAARPPLIVDGNIGPKTVKALDRAVFHGEYFMVLLKLNRLARYAVICNKDASQCVFLLGWLNRTLEVKE